MLVESESVPLAPSILTEYLPGSVPSGTAMVIIVLHPSLYFTFRVSAESVAVSPKGAVAARLMVPLNLPMDCALTVAVIDFPACVETYDGEEYIEKSGLMTCTVTVILCVKVPMVAIMAIG